MPDDIECPYCGHEQDICRDDGHGCGEDVMYEDECDHCGKAFVFYSWISFYYTAYVAPCLNDGLHVWHAQPYPREWWQMRNRFRCENCEIERDIYGY